MINNFLKNDKQVKAIITSLTTVNTSNLLEYLENIGYFISPASTLFHGAYKGGLVNHSLQVLKYFESVNKKYNLNLLSDDVIICSLFHDVCKCGAYLYGVDRYIWNINHPKGHGTLSVSMLEKVIPLSPFQKEIILYHMGIYGCVCNKGYINEYSISQLIEIFSSNKCAKLFYFCDELATIKENLKEF